MIDGMIPFRLGQRNSVFLQRLGGFTYVNILLVFFLIYLMTATWGLHLDAVSGFATYVWLPTGISLSALWIFGIRFWPAIAAGAWLANLGAGAAPWVAGGIAIGNTLEAITAVYLLKRYAFRPGLERLQDALYLIIWGAVASTALSATIGVISLAVGGVITQEAYSQTWMAWWIGDMVSNLVVASPLLVWSTGGVRIANWQGVIERLMLLMCVIFIGMWVFYQPVDMNLHVSPLTYVVYPPLIWAALRFGPRETVTCIALLSSLAIAGTFYRLGPFALSQLSESFYYLQSFMAVISVSSLILASVVWERKKLAMSKDEFFNIASHELKTPITAMKGYAQFLEKKFSNKREQKSAEMMAKLIDQIDKMISLIREMLDINKIEGGRLVYDKKSLDIDGLLESVVSELRYVTTSHSILKKGKVRVRVLGDAERIRQVVTNLISNAIQYSEPGKKILIEIKMQTNTVVVSVRDWGIGIREDHQQLIFNRFYRTMESTQKYARGFGLGLYISANIIRDHDGRMWVESTVGKGSTFYFSLPLCDVHEV